VRQCGTTGSSVAVPSSALDDQNETLGVFGTTGPFHGREKILALASILERYFVAIGEGRAD
jgi:hypothetical protein